MSNRLVNHYLNQFEKILFPNYRAIEVKNAPTALGLNPSKKKPNKNSDKKYRLEAFVEQEVLFTLDRGACQKADSNNSGNLTSNAYQVIASYVYQYMHHHLMAIAQLPGSSQKLIFKELLGYLNQQKVLYLNGFDSKVNTGFDKLLRPEWPSSISGKAVEFLIDNSEELFPKITLEELQGETTIGGITGERVEVSKKEIVEAARYNALNAKAGLSELYSSVIKMVTGNLKELLENVPEHYNPGEFFTTNNGLFSKHYEQQYDIVAGIIRANKFQYFNHDDIDAWIDLLCGKRLPEKPIKWLGPINYLVFWFKDLAVKADPNNLKVNEFNYIQFCHTQVPWELLSKHIVLKNGEPLGKKHSNNSYESLKNGKIAMNKINHLLILSEKIPV